MPRLPTPPHNVRQIRFITCGKGGGRGEGEGGGWGGEDSLPCNSRPTDAMERRIKSNITDNLFPERDVPSFNSPLAICRASGQFFTTIIFATYFG